MRILIKMIDAVRVKQRTAALYTVNFVSLRKQQLGKIRSILSSNASNQSFFHCIHYLSTSNCAREHLPAHCRQKSILTFCGKLTYWEPPDSRRTVNEKP